MSAPERPDETTTDRPCLDVGVIVAPGLTSLMPDAVAADIASELSTKYPLIQWNTSAIADRLEEPGASSLDVMETARDRMLDEDWDLVLVLTDLPLKNGRNPVQTQLSPVHSVGLVVVPALDEVRDRAATPEQESVALRTACLRLVEEILDFDDDDSADDIVHRATQRADDVLTRGDDSALTFAARVLGGKVSVILGLVRANRPLTLALRLSQLIAVTAGAGALLLITPDIWVLASNYGPVRLVVLSLIAIIGVTASLIYGAKLWEKPRRPSERQQVTLFNVATVLTVAIGVSVFYLAVFLLALAAAFLLLDAGSFTQLSEQRWSVGKIAEIAWITASLATLGGAVGAGLEEDDIIRSAAYTREPDE